MAIPKTQKTQLIVEYRVNEHDTGSPEVQVALLTTRINALVDHLSDHKNDEGSRPRLVEISGSAQATSGLSKVER